MKGAKKKSKIETKKKIEDRKLSRTRSFLPMRPGLVDHFVLTRHRTPKLLEARSASATNCSLSQEKRSSFGEVRVATPCSGGRRDLRASRDESGEEKGAGAVLPPPPPAPPTLLPLTEPPLSLPAAASRGSTNISSSSSSSEKDAAAPPLFLVPAPEPGE